MKRSGIIIVIACLLMAATSLSFAAPSGEKYKVVIDAGHGGHDSGARGKKSMEKDLTLSISLKLGEYIEKNFDDVEVIYTRKTDVFVELHRRAQIANQAKADVFISIHCNSTRSSSPMGTETWVMGLHKSEANLEVARTENAAILMEDDYEAKYDGFDPNSPEAYIIFSMFQNANLDQSLSFASLVQEQFRERAARIDRGVKQAGFLVLYRTTMPGILVEAGFLSNPDEEAYLISEEGQTYIASAIFRAFRDYRNKTSKENVVAETRNKINPEDSPVGETKGGNENTNQQARPSFQGPVIYKVQIKTSPDKIPVNDGLFTGLQDVEEYIHQGLYKYTAGKFNTFAKASEYSKQLKGKGYADAFIVAFSNGDRIDLDQARKATGEF